MPWALIVKGDRCEEERILIYKGELVEDWGNGKYFLAHKRIYVNIDDKEFKDNLIRDLSYEEREYYSKLRDKAAVAALGGILASKRLQEEVESDRNINYFDYASRLAIGHANDFIHKLIEDGDICLNQESK